jgi:hypothetical protein
MAIFNTKGKDRHVFRGAGGAICVTDGTRRRGLHGIDVWVGRLFGLTGMIPVVILVNAKGQPRGSVTPEGAVAAKAAAYGTSYFCTSTSTGDNIEKAFKALADRSVAHRRQRKTLTREGQP